MRKLAKSLSRVTLRVAGYGSIGGVLALAAVAIAVLENRPDLEVWHRAELDEEFNRHSDVSDFAGYLELEKRLFGQLDREVYQKTGRGKAGSIDRYHRGSMGDPGLWRRNWNRTFEFRPAAPAAGVLLLHGMSDSPYSLRALGESLHAAGAHVVGLRIPGHGTAPSGLVRVRWEDMAAAVELAARHLRESVGERPLYMVGYSNGGALAIEHALGVLRDRKSPRVDGIVLISPAIGVTPAAALAVWQARIGRWFGLEKLAWNSIGLEYDPFKYGSFAVNAADQTHRLTAEIRRRLDEESASGRLTEFPPVLAFQSVVDATVSTPALVTSLFDRLPEGGHELVLFDINREAHVEHILRDDPADELAALLADRTLPFTLTVVTNHRDDGRDSRAVEIRRRAAGGGELESWDPGVSWPEGMYSLSHVALPFPESDPLYGGGESGELPTLGNLALRGERGAIRVPAQDMLRQRWNPFYPLLEERVLEFTGLGRSASRSEKNDGPGR